MTSRNDGTNPRATGTNPRADGTNPRAITREWATRIEDRIARIERDTARLVAHFGLGEGQTPNTVTTTKRGMFAPGSGWITDDEAPAHYEPRASEQTAYEALAAARAALQPKPPSSCRHGVPFDVTCRRCALHRDEPTP
jgi:hypothetical protein